MNRKLKIFISIVLCLSIVFSLSAVSFAANENEKIPIILIPGFGQSEVMAYDEDGNCLGVTSEFALESLTSSEIIKSLTSPAKLKAIASKNPDMGQYVYDFLCDLFKAFRRTPDGTPIYRTEITEFNAPYSELSYEQQAKIDKHVTLDMLSDYDDVRYYFTYDTFGSVKEYADALHNYIVNVVLPQTGAKKVNIIPISQGGAGFVEYLDLYKEDYKYINKIVSMVPAFDGSIIVGDILTDRAKIYDVEYFYSVGLPEVFKTLTGKASTGYAIAAALKCVFRDETMEDILRSAVEAAVECLARNNSMLWALCPNAFYEEASEKLLSDEAHASFKAETDRYFEARENFTNNIKELQDMGVVFHTIASYGGGLYLSYLFEHGNENADDLLHISSPGIGATSAKMGETLGKDYVSPRTYCTDPAHNHISPDNTVDAATGALAENTWYFKNISHMMLNTREDVKSFAAELIINDAIVDVYTYPGQTQFVQLPEYRKELSPNGTMAYYYDENGNLMYYEAVEKDNSTADFFAKIFYSFFEKLYSFVMGRIKH